MYKTTGPEWCRCNICGHEFECTDDTCPMCGGHSFKRAENRAQLRENEAATAEVAETEAARDKPQSASP